MPGQRLLVTGISGLLGSNLARVATNAGYSVTGTYHRHAVELEHAHCVMLDLLDARATTRLVEELQPALIIHTAAMSRPDDCASDPERCRAVNVDSTRVLARAAASAHSRFMFLSSDLVYGNRTGELVEDMTLQPVGVYAGSKLDAEYAALEETAGAAMIARTSLIYGWGSGAMLCTFEDWLQTLRSDQRIRVFTDQRRCPTYAPDLARALLLASTADLSGVYNIAGREFCSRHEFAIAMAREFAIDEGLIEPCTIEAFDYSDPRPRELRLSSRRFEAATDWEPLSIASAMHELHLRDVG